MASFRKIPKGFMVFLAIIILGETLLVFFFSSNGIYEYGNGVMDVIEDIDKGTFAGAKVCIIGGSVATQAANELKVKHYYSVAALSSNIGIGMAGHYYTLKYYLESGSRPKFCFLMLYPQAWSVKLPNGFTMHGFLRPFGTLENVCDLILTPLKPSLALRMLYFGVLPSSHYKILLRGYIEERFSNMLSYFSPKNLNLNLKPPEKKLIDWKKKKELSKERKFTPSKTSEIYFPKIAEICKANKIKLFVIIPALAEADVSENEIREFNNYLESLIKDGLEFSYTKKPPFVYPNLWFNYVVYMLMKYLD